MSTLIKSTLSRRTYIGVPNLRELSLDNHDLGEGSTEKVNRTYFNKH
jgi:hypothetical protein